MDMMGVIMILPKISVKLILYDIMIYLLVHLITHLFSRALSARSERRTTGRPQQKRDQPYITPKNILDLLHHPPPRLV